MTHMSNGPRAPRESSPRSDAPATRPVVDAPRYPAVELSLAQLRPGVAGPAVASPSGVSTSAGRERFQSTTHIPERWQDLSEATTQLQRAGYELIEIDQRAYRAMGGVPEREHGVYFAVRRISDGEFVLRGVESESRQASDKLAAINILSDSISADFHSHLDATFSSMKSRANFVRVSGEGQSVRFDADSQEGRAILYIAAAREQGMPVDAELTANGRVLVTANGKKMEIDPADTKGWVKAAAFVAANVPFK